MRAAAVSGRLQVTIERERGREEEGETNRGGCLQKKKAGDLKECSVLCFFLLLISTYETIFIFCPAS